MNVEAHWLSGARRAPSENCDERPAGVEPELVVIHGISLPPGEFGGDDVEALFTNCLDPYAHPDYPELCAMRVSSHLLIDRGGAITQFVPFDRRAWHAGVSHWCGRDGCNDFSIGIELEGTDTLAYTDAQYEVLVSVLCALRRAYPAIAADAVVGHCDIAPGRKTDPGVAFDWDRLRRDLTQATA